MKLLKNNGAELNPLIAAKMGDLETARRLIEEGADVNATYGFSETPLIFASEHGNLEMVSLILEKGADVNARAADDGLH